MVHNLAYQKTSILKKSFENETLFYINDFLYVVTFLYKEINLIAIYIAYNYIINLKSIFC